MIDPNIRPIRSATQPYRLGDPLPMTPPPPHGDGPVAEAACDCACGTMGLAEAPGPLAELVRGLPRVCRIEVVVEITPAPAAEEPRP